MDTLMLVITVISLLVAAASTTIAWQVTSAERRRRAGRVAALSSAAGVQPRTEGAARPWDSPVPPESIHAGAAPVTGLFRETVRDSGSSGRQRLLMGGAVAFAGMVVLVAGVWLFGGRNSGHAAAASGAPLELVALGHTRSGGVLAVTGLVRNPTVGAAVRNLVADVRVFDAAGIMIATKSGPVEIAELAPGHESPFTLAIGEATTAARYRVSFSTAGTMLPHVDRRLNPPSAVSQTADAR